MLEDDFPKTKDEHFQVYLREERECQRAGLPGLSADLMALVKRRRSERLGQGSRISGALTQANMRRKMERFLGGPMDQRETDVKPVEPTEMQGRNETVSFQEAS